MPEHALYEIINPSDPYTFRAVTDHVAVYVILVLGGGKYGGCKVDDDAWQCPMLLFCSDAAAAKLVEEALGEPLDGFKAAHRADIVAALRSVRIGDPGDREALDDVVADLPEAARETFLAKRHDKRRSSLNDIGARALAYAKALEEGADHA